MFSSYFSQNQSPIEIVICAALLLICTITDLKDRKIYNSVVFPVMLVGFLWVIAVSIAASYANLGRLLVFVGVFMFGATGLIGLGDIKLCMALSLLTPPIILLIVILAAEILLLTTQFLWAPAKTLEKVQVGLYAFRTRGLSKLKKNVATEGIPFAPFLAISYYAVIAGGFIYAVP